MKIIVEFELTKPEPDILDLIAQRIYTLECIDKTKDVTAKLEEEES